MGEKIQHVAQMPAITWYGLKANEADIELPCELTTGGEGCVEVVADAALLGEAGAFEAAMDAAQEAWLPLHADDEVACSTAHAKDEEAAYGGLAMSVYQKRADEIELARDLRVAFETGLGKEASAWLRETAAQTVVFTPKEGAGNAAIHVRAADRAAAIAAIDVVAAPGADFTLDIVVDSPDAGTGLAATTLRVFAGAGAHVQVRRVQTLDATWTDLDDMGLFLDADAHVEISQSVLGAQKSVNAVAGDLRGDASRADVAVRYLGRGDSMHDFNYNLRHHGKKTECAIVANGVLAGASRKTLRGTIDLVKGAKGAQGAENESVLLVDEGVRNTTVPVILCNEDDVAGNHGAAIGHIRPDQMFYMASRGLAPTAAEQMFSGAYLEAAWLEACDEAAKTAVARLGKSVVEDFEEVCA